MQDEFAVSDGELILYQSDGFQLDLVTETLSLSGGKTLLICGQDKLILAQRLQEAEGGRA